MFQIQSGFMKCTPQCSDSRFWFLRWWEGWKIVSLCKMWIAYKKVRILKKTITMHIYTHSITQVIPTFSSVLQPVNCHRSPESLLLSHTNKYGIWSKVGLYEHVWFYILSYIWIKCHKEMFQGHSSKTLTMSDPIWLLFMGYVEG